ncbi:MAG: LuxR C-terminal-related transcriptional regulator [Acidobacteriota bacterium]
MQVFAVEVIVDGQDRIVLWEADAERLFGYPASKALGLRLQDLLDGRDIFGNRFCREACWLRETFRSGETVRQFELDVRHAGGHRIRVVAGAGTDRPAQGWTYRFQPDRRRSASPAALREEAGETLSSPLTARELDILRLLAQGAQTPGIARELGISSTTVRNHVQNLLRKLGAHNRLQAVSAARRHGLL